MIKANKVEELIKVREIISPDPAYIITAGFFVVHICHIPKVVRKVMSDEFLD